MCVHCYKLASEEARHRILSYLKNEDLAVGEMAKRLKLKQPTVTHHLKKLSDAGLVRMVKDGRVHRYSLSLKSECFMKCGLLTGLVPNKA